MHFKTRLDLYERKEQGILYISSISEIPGQVLPKELGLNWWAFAPVLSSLDTGKAGQEQDPCLANRQAHTRAGNQLEQSVQLDYCFSCQILNKFFNYNSSEKWTCYGRNVQGLNYILVKYYVLLENINLCRAPRVATTWALKSTDNENSLFYATVFNFFLSTSS